MKPAIRFIKTALLCFLMFAFTKSNAQLLPTTFTTTQGQCVSLGIDSLLAGSGATLDSFTILAAPQNGQLVPGGGPDSWFYCPDSAFTGTDQAYVYFCISGPTFPICDTANLVFTVQPNNCNNLTVAVQNGPCAGPLPSLMAVVTGGTPPYTYLWNDASTNDVICNLSTGTYCVTVVDANGCSVSSCQSVTGGGCQLTGTIVLDSVNNCLLTTVTGGTPPYSYQWSDSSTGSSVCNINPLHSYIVVVTDADGCRWNFAYGGGCQLYPVISQSGSCLAVGGSDGTFPFSYQWNTGEQTPAICPTSPGMYCITVTDGQGCTAVQCETIGGGCQLTAAIILDSINCSGQLGLTAIVTGGTPPYTYTWSGGIPGARPETTCGINPATTYIVTITDSAGCATTGTYGGSGCSLVSTIAQSGNCLVATVTGGTPGYTFQWSDGSITSSICPNNPGNYCVTITDAQGCSDVQCGTIGGGCQISAAIISDSLNNCLSVVATGGTPPFMYIWSDSSTQSTTCGVNPGSTYCVSVIDANGCVATACNGTNPSCTFTYIQNTPTLQTLVVFVASFDQQLSPANIVWDLGDGNIASGFQITHIYNACDFVYDVTMTLVDTNGNNLCSSSQYVYVYCDSMNRYCQASFTSYQDSANNLTFHFIDQSVYNPVAYQWDFGDGNFSAAQNPSHNYTTAGIYNVCLVVTDATGCASTSCQQINAGNVQIQDLAAYLYHYTTITPGFPLWSNLSYCNYGTTLMNGTVEYRYPAGTTFTSATPAPASHDAAQRLLTFNFSNLLPNTCGYIAVDLMVDASLPLGSIANDTMWVKPIADDANPADNISTVSEVIIGSWDPNDKAVSPKGMGDDGEIAMNTETLAYKIRFQNTGTAPAVNVVIRDAMDSNIDLTSVRVMDASHEHITQIIGNELVVTFNNIMLPDSNSNEPESHGYIQVIANLKPGLTEGTQIFNTAEIYFDFNEAVITNTVVNTLKDATGIRQIAGFEFGIMPNPAQEQIMLSGKFSRDAQFEIINELGQIVLSDDVTSDKMQVNIQSLITGIYFVKIISSDKTGVQRLIVNK